MKVIVIGAGAAGLMAARELGKVGHSVTILEARYRIGGRIWPLSEDELNYPAQAGAEFVHGNVPYTRALAAEAGLSVVPREGKAWNARSGEIVLNTGGDFPPELSLRISELKDDMPLADFLQKYFSADKYESMRESIIWTAQSYDAADLSNASTLTFAKGWLSGGFEEQLRLVGGYGPLLEFLQTECYKHNVEIKFNSVVNSVEYDKNFVTIRTKDKKTFDTEKIIITVPLPLLREIEFIPPLPRKIDAAERIGFGGAVKVLVQFKSPWWTELENRKFADLVMILTDSNNFSAWWTQYPNEYSVLVGWAAGPLSKNLKGFNETKIAEFAIETLATTFGISGDKVREQFIKVRIFDWSLDPYARGAYSYPTIGSKEAKEELLEPVAGKIYFAGEALGGRGTNWSTVEAALSSGAEVAEDILKSIL